MINQTKAQNLVEYILLAAAVIVVFLILLNPQQGPMKQSVERSMNQSVDMINGMANSISFR